MKQDEDLLGKAWHDYFRGSEDDDDRLTDRELVVELEDGSRPAAPVALFPILADATSDELLNWKVIGGGRGIHWPDLDEHVSVWSVVHPDRTAPMRSEAIERHLARNRARRSRRVG